MNASYSRIFKIAVPIMLSNAMVPLIGMVDAAVIGRLGEVAPLAAVGIGTTFISMMFWLFNFFDITTTAEVGRARGSGDFEPVERHLRRSFVLAGVLSFFILLSIPFWLWSVPHIFSASDEIKPFLQSYVGIRLLGMPVALCFHIVTGFLLGWERTRLLLGLEFFIQIINLVLDVLFVLGMGLGVEGVALASVIAEYSGFVFTIYILRKELAPIFARWPRSLRLGQGARKFLQNNGFLFVRALGLHMVILIFYRVGSELGDVAVAVNTVLMIYVNFAAQATDGFAVATEILVAQSLGQKNLQGMRKNILRTAVVSASLAFLIILLFMFFGRQLFGLISTNEELRAIAPIYLPYVALAIGVGVISWALDGIFFGANMGREMMIGMLITLAGYVLLLWILVPIWGNHGLWVAFIGSYALRALGLMIFYPNVEREAQP